MKKTSLKVLERNKFRPKNPAVAAHAAGLSIGRSNRQKMALYGVFFIALTAVTVNPVSAWTWSNKTTVYSAPLLCIQGQAGIDHYQPGLFSGNLAYANTYALAGYAVSGGCSKGLDKPNGSAAVRLDVYKWTGSTWVVCRGTNWKYGATGTNQWGPWGPSEVFDYGGSSACGAGYYGTMAYSYVWDGSAWRGGSVWSGYEYVP
jgi:hypothetical protein